MVSVLVVGLGAAVWFAFLGRAGLMAARIYQLEEYMPMRFLLWSRRRPWALSRAALIAGPVALIVTLGRLGTGSDASVAWVGAGWLAGAAILHAVWRPLPPKKALVYTGRMRRLLAASVVTAAGAGAGIASLLFILPVAAATILAVVVCMAALFISSLLIVAGDILTSPVETLVQRRFLRRARDRMTRDNLATVAVAGSYGKTSTKHIMAQLLDHQISTLATPKSFNTLMGISRTINDLLKPEHRVFVVEMDAYDVGEIARSCRLAPPDIAIVTSIGPQHLDRFGSMGRIADAIYEVVEALPAAGTAVIYCGDVESARLADRAEKDGHAVVRYGTEGANEGRLDVVAEEVVVTGQMTQFNWRWPSKGMNYSVTVPLLGAHNAINVTAALAVIHLLGCQVDDAVRNAALLEPIPHRLQVMSRRGGVTVIDDSYNANPVGVHVGLEVLQQMNGRTKILVTPGMVELGPVEESENRRYGEHAAHVCDHVILVGGERTDSLYDGLRSGGLATESIHRVRTLEEATVALTSLTAFGDVVLFANDLPDTYSELN